MLHQTAACAELGLAEFLLHMAQFVTNDDRHALRLGQNVQEVFNLGHHFFVLSHDLVLFQTGQALQTHLQNFLRLRVRQAVQAIAAHAVLFFQAIGAVVVGIDDAAIRTGTCQHLAHQLAVPGARHQLGLGHGRCG